MNVKFSQENVYRQQKRPLQVLQTPTLPTPNPNSNSTSSPKSRGFRGQRYNIFGRMARAPFFSGWKRNFSTSNLTQRQPYLIARPIVFQLFLLLLELCLTKARAWNASTVFVWSVSSARGHGTSTVVGGGGGDERAQPRQCCLQLYFVCMFWPKVWPPFISSHLDNLLLQFLNLLQS